MKRKELEAILKQTGFPVAFVEFDISEEQTESGRIPKLPFVAYVATKTEQLYADGMVIHCEQSYDVELYTGEKNEKAEEAMENTLIKASIGWEKEEYTIKEEEMYVCIYHV